MHSPSKGRTSEEWSGVGERGEVELNARIFYEEDGLIFLTTTCSTKE